MNRDVRMWAFHLSSSAFLILCIAVLVSACAKFSDDVHYATALPYYEYNLADDFIADSNERASRLSGLASSGGSLSEMLGAPNSVGRGIPAEPVKASNFEVQVRSLSIPYEEVAAVEEVAVAEEVVAVEEVDSVEEFVFSNPQPQSAPGPATTDIVIALDRIISRLRKGNIQYTAPSEVSDRGQVEIGAIIGIDISEKELTEELRKHFPTVSIESDTLSVAEIMVGSIKSRGFDFTPSEPVARVVSNVAPTVWHWVGVPKEVGPQTVILTMNARLKVNGELIADQLVETWRKEIVVKVSYWDLILNWFLDNIEWAWGALVLPVLVIFRKKILSLLAKFAPPPGADT